MLSESARMTSAAEASFRIQAPNSIPRATKIIALDAPSEGVVRRLAKAHWNQATFLTAPVSDSTAEDSDGPLSDLAGRETRVRDEVNAADQVIMVASAGANAQAAAIIGRACSLKHVTTTTLVVGATSASGEALSKTLAQLRPWSLMVVIADNDDYIEDMLTALRA
jgi:hypothetical protein